MRVRFPYAPLMACLTILILWVISSYGAYRAFRYFFFHEYEYDGSDFDKAYVCICVLASIMGPVSLIIALLLIGIDRVFEVY